MYSFVLSCEHAGHFVPEAYRYLFSGREDVLQTHRGWDPGAMLLAQRLATALRTSVFSCATTRLLIEPNRSLHSSQLFSEFSNTLPAREKQHLVDTIYTPFRQAVEDCIRNQGKPVLQLSIHTFTPVWGGEERAVDIGILFDPDRQSELSFCTQLHDALSRKLPSFRVRYNEPYAGKDDGHTTYLRTRFSDGDYLGVELEINQKFYFNGQLSLVVQKLEETLLPLVG